MTYLCQRPDFYSNPYPFYRVLLEHRPVSRNVLSAGVALVSYEDVSRAMRDPRFSSVREPNDAPIPGGLAVDPSEYEAARRFRNRWILQMDGPEHDALRASVRHAFTPRAMERLSSEVARIVDDVLSVNEGRGEVDLVDDVAAPLVGMSLCTAMGVPTEDWRTLRGWADYIVGMIPPHLSEREGVALAHKAVWAMKSYADSVLASATASAAVPLAAVRTALSTGALTCEDGLGLVVLLLSAGHHSIVHAICNAINALFAHPRARARFERGDVSITAAIEELLRYDAAVGLLSRRLTEDVDVRGSVLARGTTVALVPGAANRDPAAFSDPDQLDLDRTPNPHLSFGLGSHYCLGAALSRLIVAIAIPAMLTRFPSMELASSPMVWTSRRMNHGPISMRVRLENQSGAHALGRIRASS